MYMRVYVFMYIMYIYQFVHNIGLSPNHDESSIMYHKSSIYVDFISKRMLLLVYSQFEIVCTRRLFIAIKKKKKKKPYPLDPPLIAVSARGDLCLRSAGVYLS